MLRFIERLQTMDRLISKCNTGTPSDFAKKIGISRSVLMENLREMREMGAGIEYCSYRRTYFYTKRLNLLIGELQQEDIKGGSMIFKRIRFVRDLIEQNGSILGW